jgi:hypothetical protein
VVVEEPSLNPTVSQTGEYRNLVSKGIIDPTKVVRVAIQNAASIAALLITTEAMDASICAFVKDQRTAGHLVPEHDFAQDYVVVACLMHRRGTAAHLCRRAEELT